MNAECDLNVCIKERDSAGPHLTTHEHVGLNGKIAVIITNAVGTMWCAYVFAVIALISLPSSIAGGVSTLIAWIAQTFLQLVRLIEVNNTLTEAIHRVVIDKEMDEGGTLQPGSRGGPSSVPGGSEPPVLT
jgi:hypothetical protein